MKLPLCCMINPIVFDSEVTTFGLCREHASLIGSLFGFSSLPQRRNNDEKYYIGWLKASVEALGDPWKQ